MHETHGSRDLKSALIVLDPKISDGHGTNGLCTEYAARKFQNGKVSLDRCGRSLSTQFV